MSTVGPGTATTNVVTTTTTGQKENNRNAGNTKEYYSGNKKFTGANEALKGKIFDVTSREAVHQFADTLKAVADYVGQQYTHGGDVRFMIENLQDFTFVRPPNPQDASDQYELESWKKQLDLHWKRRGIYEDNKMKLYSLIWGQSTKSTQSKLETHDDFQDCRNAYDSLKLIKILREFVFKSDDRQYKYKAEDQAKRNYYNLRQTPEMSCQEYFERVRNVVDVIKSLGGSLVDDMHLPDELPEVRPRSGYTNEQRASAREKIQNKTIAYGILVRADRSRYGKLIEEIENDYLKGNNDYPKTPTEAYNLLVNYRSYNHNKRPAGQGGGLDHVAFVTEGKRQRQEGEPKYYPHIKCFKCNQMGHYKSDCPKKGNDGNTNSNEGQEPPAITLTTLHVSLAVLKKEINPMWILCDSESTVDIFKNRALLMNIRKTSRPIRLKGIEGKTIDVEEEGDLLGYGPVYYHHQVTANVLSFFNMARRFRSIVYDNNICDAFMVTRDDGTIIKFEPSTEGLYYYDFTTSVKRHQERIVPTNTQSTMMIETVNELQRNYTARELKQMDEARRLYVIMGRPSKADFIKILKRGKILDNPVRIEDFNNAERVYGRDLGVVKGKTIRTRPNRVVIDTETAAMERLNIILAVDVMTFTGMSFLMTVSRAIGFITATCLRDRKRKTIADALKQVLNVYKGRGHTVEQMNFTEQNQPVHTILGDNEFEAIKEDMLELGVSVNITAREEHVPEIERQHRVIKERARAIIQTLPYKCMPKRMRIALIQNVVFWLNNIPKIGQDHSPRDLICGEQLLNYRTICRIPFGAYAQVHDDQSVTNTMTSRTTGAISLGTSGNVQGTYRFMSLRTGDILVRRTWTELPMPSEVVDRVMELTTNEVDYTDYQNELQDLDDELEDDEDAGDQIREPEINVDSVTESETEEREMNQNEEAVQLEQNIAPLDDQQMGEEVEEAVITSGVSDTINEEEEDKGSELDDSGTADNHEQPKPGYNLRPNRTRNYSYRFTFLSVREGIKRFGQRGKEAILDELKLFLNEKVFKKIKEITEDQRRKALRIHCFLTEKRDGRIKARAVADGRTQKRYTMEETYSPTVKLESIMLCTLIEALEGRYVATVDIKGAFLKAKVPDDLELIVKMDGELAEAFVELNPDFELDEDGILYLQCDKALYGHIEAARLFYDELDNTLQHKMGFIKNQYDPCVYNKKMDKDMITIKTHVDDLKISAVEKQNVTWAIEQLRKIYQDITVDEGDVHDYLGMIMEHDRKLKMVKIDMTKYIQETIESFKEEEPEERLKPVNTPATNNLFKTRTNVEKLSSRRAGIYHSTVAKLLFVAKRARPDILLAVSFMTTRVKQPDLDDWHKLVRVLSYLNESMNMTLTLSCDKIDKLKWYIDGSYASHADMRGQSGAVLTTGECAVLFKSSKQKVNTRSSTETELIAVDDILPTVQWARSFMAEQGYDVETEIQEDNRSTMMLMKNGRLSSGKRTKHLDIRYFFVKDLLDRDIITMAHCLSENMIADFFTKPIQGKRFQYLRKLILNIDYPDGHRSVLGNKNTEDAQLDKSLQSIQTEP